MSRHFAGAGPSRLRVAGGLPEGALLGIEDYLYIVAMCMFALLPLEGVFNKAELGEENKGHRRAPGHLRPKLIAICAFMLLLTLQLRKQYTWGIALVCINLGLRLYELYLLTARHRPPQNHNPNRANRRAFAPAPALAMSPRAMSTADQTSPKKRFASDVV